MDTEWTRAATDNEFGNLFLGEERQEDALQTQMMRIGECEVEVEVMGRESGHVYDKTGMMCWEGGECLGQIVYHVPEMCAEKVILELGAGCVPLPSLAACRAGADRCFVTDGSETVLRLAKENVERNYPLLESTTKVVFHNLIWGETVDVDALQCQELHWILGADVVYAEAGTTALFKTASALMEAFPQAKLLLCYVVRGVNEGQIFHHAKETGLTQMPLPSEISNAHTDTVTRLAMFMKRKEPSSIKCMKCSTRFARVLVRQRHPLCIACLFDNVESKFRSLFKTKGAIQPGDRVLLEGSGSIASQSALDLLLQYRHPSSATVRRGKTFFSLAIVHLKEPSIPDSDSTILCAVHEILSRHQESAAGVEVQSIALPSIDWSSAYPEIDETARLELQRIYKTHALLKIAQRNKCNVVVSLDTSTSLAQGVLSASCKGGGCGISASLELFDRRFTKTTGVSIIRPLKELSAAELAFYCHFKKLTITTTSIPASNSVDGLAEQFIHSLQDTFPSGVSSMLSMGSKLKSIDWDSTSLCSICSEPLPHMDDIYCYPCQMHIVPKLTSDRLDQLICLLRQF